MHSSLCSVVWCEWVERTAEVSVSTTVVNSRKYNYYISHATHSTDEHSTAHCYWNLSDGTCTLQSYFDYTVHKIDKYITVRVPDVVSALDV
jgi:hypothetical protein